MPFAAAEVRPDTRVAALEELHALALACASTTARPTTVRDLLETSSAGDERRRRRRLLKILRHPGRLNVLRTYR